MKYTAPAPAIKHVCLKLGRVLGTGRGVIATRFVSPGSCGTAEIKIPTWRLVKSVRWLSDAKAFTLFNLHQPAYMCTVDTRQAKLNDLAARQTVCVPSLKEKWSTFWTFAVMHGRKFQQRRSETSTYITGSGWLTGARENVLHPPDKLNQCGNVI